jgi:hypothetical protein
MEAWRTNCPRLTVWEDAIEGGFVALERDQAGALVVRATRRGLALLNRAPAAPE